ncbi:MAG: ARMT1-like domain-containing protein [Planctomycetota bacterium]|nr:ARMT1-like domain-containing protein [Planctomycetota bacterium]
MSSDLKVQPDCLSCILRQTLRVSRAATDNEWLHRRASKAVLQQLQETDFSTSPAELLSNSVTTALKTLGAQDPMAKQRSKLRRELLPLIEEFRQEIASEASLEFAIKAAASANLVDQRALMNVDLVSGIKILYEGISGKCERRIAKLIHTIEESRQILYILDNAGEAEIDLLLVEQLVKRGKSVTLVVKSPGLLHDVTREDIETEVPVIETGSNMMGSLPVLCSKEFSSAMADADLIIAKGASNFETLGMPADKAIAHMLVAKCGVLARALGIKKGQVAMIFADGRRKV